MAYGASESSTLESLTRDWGTEEERDLYLERCQVDTPDHVVRAAWQLIATKRPNVGRVVDFGAGDARFARGGHYVEYQGFEIDPARQGRQPLPAKAHLTTACAFTHPVVDADVAVGNPPFVRNQDLPPGWRAKVSKILEKRTGLALSGLANAWQYFFLLSLVSVSDDGLCALVIPHEWVSRPSAAPLRNHIEKNKWAVEVYKLRETTFTGVLTTSSITLVDKASKSGTWTYYSQNGDGTFQRRSSPHGSRQTLLTYRSKRNSTDGPRVKRGLSPGTQKVLTLTEGERARAGLREGRDVVPCVTTLRPFPVTCKHLDRASFDAYYKDTGQKCWLIRTDAEPKSRLASYLASVPASEWQTSTCLERDDWWRFLMPDVPVALASQTFKGQFPKAIVNDLGVRAVGGVCGIFGISGEQAEQVSNGLNGLDLRRRILPYAKGLYKIEINQFNDLLAETFEGKEAQ